MRELKGETLIRRRASRRDVLGALAGAAAAAINRSGLAAPSFESGGHQFTILRPRPALPSVRLFGLGGGTTDLKTLCGEPILLNFWASWCAACRTELPILDRLHRDRPYGPAHVVAVSVDRGSRAAVERFVGGLGIRALPIYWDPHGIVASSDGVNGGPFALYGMPITYLVASSGEVMGYIQGAADWSSSAAARLIAYLRIA